jgi:DNA processing protein
MAPALSDENRDLLALTLTPGLGPRLIGALLNQFGSATAARRAPADQLEQIPHLGRRLAEELAGRLAAVDVESELALLTRHQVHLLPRGNPLYPASLATIPDPPPLLYLHGTLKPADARAVALVGSRHCTSYGKKSAERLASGLGRAGVTVISGLARGIDGIAHRASLEAGGRTLAVLAGGLSRIYPPEHRELADAVAASGALLTEASMTQEPLAGLFPVRNRIISGLSQVIVIVEAAEKSGALITATHAGEQGRIVMAVPGPIDSEASGGCHRLLREGAILCRGAEDILEELHGVSAMEQMSQASGTPAPEVPVAPPGPPPGLDEVGQQVWEFLGSGSRAVDELAQHLRMAVPSLSGLLLTLEMKRAVRRLPGNRYERC